MKKLFLASLLLLAASFESFAQPSLSNNPQSSPRFRSNNSENSGFGIKGGVNFCDLTGDGVSKTYKDVKWLTQYHFGAYAQIGVSNRFSIQPEILYQRKGFESSGETFRNRTNTADSVGTGSTTTKMSYLSAPILMVFNIFDNVAIQLGPQVSYLLSLREGSKNVEADAYNYKSVEVSAVGGVEAKVEFLRIGARYDYSLTDLRDKGDFTISGVKRQSQSDIRNGVFQVYLGVGL